MHRKLRECDLADALVTQLRMCVVCSSGLRKDLDAACGIEQTAHAPMEEVPLSEMSSFRRRFEGSMHAGMRPIWSSFDVELSGMSMSSTNRGSSYSRCMSKRWH